MVNAVLDFVLPILTKFTIVIIMAALHSRCGRYIFVLYLLSFFPRLISAAADWMSTTHGVVLVRI